MVALHCPRQVQQQRFRLVQGIIATGESTAPKCNDHRILCISPSQIQPTFAHLDTPSLSTQDNPFPFSISCPSQHLSNVEHPSLETKQYHLGFTLRNGVLAIENSHFPGQNKTWKNWGFVTSFLMIFNRRTNNFAKSPCVIFRKHPNFASFIA